jgi:hypothetical protein
MRYRAPLLDHETGTLSNDHYRVLSSAQLARFASWSIQSGRPVLELMAGFVIEEIPWPHNDGREQVELIGTLPHCSLFGAVMPDGSTHT